MRTIACRQLVLGEGRPKICVPVIAKTMTELKEAAALAASCPSAEIVEWRADWYEDIWSEGIVFDVMKVLREKLKEIPILFTFRSRQEGGEREAEKEQYTELVKTALKAGADLIDIELSRGDEVVRSLIGLAHEADAIAVVSSHDFEKTPGTESMMSVLLHMYQLGADICKLAVMPQDPLDTLRLLEATWRLKNEHQDMLLITMSMSQTGSISRICGEVFGSVLTFGTAGEASAPGQMDARRMQMILDALHGE